jgi:hypothetical protein
MLLRKQVVVGVTAGRSLKQQRPPPVMPGQSGHDMAVL